MLFFFFFFLLKKASAYFVHHAVMHAFDSKTECSSLTTTAISLLKLGPNECCSSVTMGWKPTTEIFWRLKQP